MKKKIKSFESILAVTKKILEKIILNECLDPNESFSLIEEGIKLIQSKISSNLIGFIEEERKFIEKARPLIDETVEISTKEEPILLEKNIEIYQEFISEALEHLGTIELNIINLEQSPEDKDCINSIFRPFHTIKGVSGFLNLKEIHQFSHAMETLLDRARNGTLKINQEIVDFILDAVDLLRRMILDLREQLDLGKLILNHYDIKPYLERIELFEDNKENVYQTEEKVKLSKIPKSEDINIDVPPLGEILNSKGVVEKEDIIKALEKQRGDNKKLKIGEILISENKAKPKEIIQALREQKQITLQKIDSTIRIDVKKLDNLMDMVGELVIALSLVQQNPLIMNIKDQKLTKDFLNLKRITNELQKISMSLRMVPIKQTFQKMIRLVRDQAKKSGKMIELIFSGEETEIDRNMVESLYEPLVHMIRNSIDHGVELPEKRRSIGKQETGKIFLRARQQGGNIVIEVEDDGEGLNRNKILKKAREKGLISEENNISDDEIYSFIFEPGFSTTDRITDVSGRGVGMDVVKKVVERLKGKIDVFSEEGKGTKFIIRIPLTLAIMDGIIVKIGDERFIIPAEFVKETLRPHREEIFTVHQRGDLIKVRGKLLPILKPEQIIGVSLKKENPWETLLLILENNGIQSGLMIDDLLGKQEIVVKNIGEKFRDIRGVAGATIMGDGRVGLILDIYNLLNMRKVSANRYFTLNGMQLN